MYPIKFKNLYFEKIWGGRDLGLFRSNLPEGDIGESWDISCHPNGMSIVANGKFQNMRFDELIKKMGDKIVGTKIDKENFPLLVKIINATDKLSIQVHPDDRYANRVENQMGKTEAWYVIKAFPGASLIVGTKEGCTLEQFRNGISNGNLERYMNRIPVEKGDVYFIRSGMIHAICEGVILAEIQQSSDITYRVYDYNRGRELHVKKALDVVNLKLRGEKSTGLRVERQGFFKTYICISKEFSLELYDIYKEAVEISDKERFYIFTCVEGQGDIIYDNGAEPINVGDSILIPASLGEYRLRGNMKLVKSYVPDFEKVESEILKEVEKI
ncbi:type I phosphomannose isomerase catalytic subunit [Clostridium tyrobutyricum]|uniref:type I phosphomannose isomerase catalytic subunit n=1 Tax=Clostridium tyrobutyricum TaxID=1519 RepID=UPI001C385C34|nr:type I phosphomannose isomerase catalytic subunit [Clostridium tyrobutyricum]MBV4423359.1 class I mannose-6-phosphate isomerase [Clostridium tyrobutyricum]